ncbi:hypothetical protein ACFFRR_004217 [Megaselia abdita]
MKTLLVAFILSYHGSVLAYNANIDICHYGLCEKEIRSYNLGEPGEFIEPHSFLYIPALINNENKYDEILRTKFYFRGKSDFSVAVSKFEDSKIIPFFQTIVAYYTINSAIFTRKVYSTGSTPYCYRTTRDNMFSTVYYEEFLLVVTKGGVMSWYIGNENTPFLRCFDIALKNINYISFSGYNSRSTDVYYADCPI